MKIYYFKFFLSKTQPFSLHFPSHSLTFTQNNLMLSNNSKGYSGSNHPAQFHMPKKENGNPMQKKEKEMFVCVCKLASTPVSVHVHMCVFERRFETEGLGHYVYLSCSRSYNTHGIICFHHSDESGSTQELEGQSGPPACLPFERECLRENRMQQTACRGQYHTVGFGRTQRELVSFD